MALQLMVLHTPILSKLFEVIPLSGLDLSIAVGAGVIVFMVMELHKKFQK